MVSMRVTLETQEVTIRELRQKLTKFSQDAVAVTSEEMSMPAGMGNLDPQRVLDALGPGESPKKRRASKRERGILESLPLSSLHPTYAMGKPCIPTP